MIDNAELSWLIEPCATIDNATMQAARDYQNTLTKPPGSLGRLEDIAIRFAGWQGDARPKLNQISVRIFAGDHGLCAQNISAFPQAVTAQMIDNFIAGGAAINVLSRIIHADFDILSLGTVIAPKNLDPSKNLSLGQGTADCSQQPAMSEQQLIAALKAGRQAIDMLPPCELFIAGEMGIGNTAAASLLYALLLQEPVAALTGPGTGLRVDELEHKKTVLTAVQRLHQPAVSASPTPALCALQMCGGFEIAALCGAYLRATQKGIPVLVDGFISTAAWFIAWQLQPRIADWSLFAHCSAEPAHQRVLQHIDKRPLLDLKMRLGEGSGAALAVPLLQQALALHSEMATFERAGVNDSL